MTKKLDPASIFLDSQVNHPQLSRDAARSLGVIRVMLEATAVTLQRYGMAAAQTDALKQEILEEYTRMTKQHGKRSYKKKK